MHVANSRMNDPGYTCGAEDTAGCVCGRCEKPKQAVLSVDDEQGGLAHSATPTVLGHEADNSSEVANHG